MYPQEENDLVEIVDDEKCEHGNLYEFKKYPNNSGLIKLKDAETILTTKNATACVIIGKGVNVTYRPSKKEGISHLVLDVLSGKIRCNIIGWNFIETKNETKYYT